MAEQDVAAQVRAMRSVRDFERLKAAGAFEEMTPEVVQEVGEVVARGRRTTWWRYHAVDLCAFGVLIALAVALVSAHHKFGSVPGVFLVLLLVEGPSIAGFARRVAFTKLHRRAADVLIGCGDLRAVGEMAGLLSVEDRGIALRAQLALPALLDKIGAGDAGLLSLEARKRLVAGMRPGAGPYNLAVIEAFARIGDWSCLPQAKRIAEGSPLLWNGPEVQHRAAELLAVFEDLRDRERSEAKLLRAADAPPDATLLRPAASAPHEEDAKLLRPAEEPAQEVEAHGWAGCGGAGAGHAERARLRAAEGGWRVRGDDAGGGGGAP